MKRYFSLCAALVVLAGSLCAQRMPDSDIPSRPPTGFSDVDGVLRNDPVIAQRIVDQISDLRERHGYRFYLVVETSLISTSPGQFAARLQQEWLPEGGGLVIVFEADTRHLGFGRSLDASEGLVENESGVPAYELVGTVSKAMEKAEGAETPTIYLGTLVGEMSTGLQEYFKRKNAPVDGSRSFKLTLVTVGFLSLLALCGMGLGWLMGKSDKRQSEKRTFPPADVPERLSAPYGGGGGGYGKFGGGEA